MKRYIAAAAVAAAGLAGAAALAVSAYLSLGEPARFIAPGAGTVEVAAPGRYVIWHKYRTTFENRSYRSEAGLPSGAQFTVRGPDGPPLRVASAGSQSWKGGAVERMAVGRFEAPVAGRYTIAGVENAPGDPHKELRDMATLVYALYAASILMGITLVGGLVVAYLKRDDAAGTWLESHYRWQIRTFWWTLLWGAIGFLTALILVGFAILFGAAVWFIYRVAKGWLALRAGKPVGVPSQAAL